MISLAGVNLLHCLPVPDYFQEDSEDALRSRAQWLESEVGLGDSFFTRVLRTDENAFRLWKGQQLSLGGGELLALREVWEMMMHVLSLVNFDAIRARRLLEHVPPNIAGVEGTSQESPWMGESIKTYLEKRGRAAVDDVNRWITSFRFGAPALTPEQEAPCPSTPD